MLALQTGMKEGKTWQVSSPWFLADSIPEVRLQTLDLDCDMSNSGEFLWASELTISGPYTQIPCEPYLDLKKELALTPCTWTI